MADFATFFGRFDSRRLILLLSLSQLMSVFIKGLCGRMPFFTGFIPSLSILTICAFYEPGYLKFLIPVAGALGFALIYQRLVLKTIVPRMIAMSLLFWLAWYFFQWGCVFVLLFIVIHDFFRKDHISIPVTVIAVVNALVFYLGDAYLVPFSSSVRWIDFMTMNGLALATVLSVPAIIVHSAWSSLFLNKYSRDTLKKIRLYEAAVFAVCSVVFVAWLYADPVNRDTRTLSHTVYHVNNGMWDAVLREDTKTLYKHFPDRAGALQFFMVHATNHALLQKGQIGEKLLNYPQAAFTYDPQMPQNRSYWHRRTLTFTTHLLNATTLRSLQTHLSGFQNGK